MKDESLKELSIKESNSLSISNDRVAITTIDNPYDPFTQFNDWYLFDMQKGYNTCAYLDRIAETSDSLSDNENEEEIERAIDEIIKYDFMNIYKKVINPFY